VSIIPLVVLFVTFKLPFFLFRFTDKIVNDQKEVANHFNHFFSTVAENIGKDTVYDPSDHPSLIEIKKQNEIGSVFSEEKIFF
jgi:hypothetical protein